ncbi:2-amino-4-hydroxy-6-hydroxymethyldihydropteridine diphosphokinase [Neptunicella marina]|uniref:2-amino-4-hydroxy-6-hydroxymethyldihydropteridine pyrophosphokinase n=1 Tax=Neptunicella marina TaxID=2125989 RepID=A0A8J6ISK7_9ALTE|nr:2-amino-4-hydroxy-6-hydroxymethyldihydropteridine diphosphokinase [Neptunicella marina]MBC3766006.1 2-amino-4-hydroxy-6-hydroxymethyldihydropteridine diphosphokinase [Neptunicella marina]
MITVYIGLGSNLANPAQQLVEARNAIIHLEHCQLTAQSSLYCSVPMGPQDQPNYINAVVVINTQLDALDLLDALQSIENQHGRERIVRWGSRTLDLDILLYGNQQIDLPRLTVPHYGLTEREFVLHPMLEISPELTLPGGESLAELCQQVPLNGMKKIQFTNW